MVTLIVSEKPAAAKKIAESLADGKPLKENIGSVPVYRLTRGNTDIIVGCSAGHLFGLAEKEKRKGMPYPVFDVAWTPLSDISKKSAYSQKYLNALKKIAKQADDVIVGTDLDTEGEVIGWNIVRFICKHKDAKRMRFSTLTSEDLQKAYQDASPHIDWGLALAGETRHFLDYYYGINLSRALMHAIKTSGMFKILSTGRVQGPALKILVDREMEIRAFKPEAYFRVELVSASFSAWHEKDKFWKKEEADAVMQAVSGCKQAVVADVQTQHFRQKPPPPFDLTTLQTESYRCFSINPKRALSIAQDLYTAGYISYPRTSSQQLPASIGYAGIKKKLAKKYPELVKLTGDVPNNGAKTDPAHPAIYPTGSIPRSINEQAAKVYDLIVKRFLATFGEPAVRETVKARLNANSEIFVVKGTHTTKAGWHVLYHPYVKQEEIELPPLKQKEVVAVEKFARHDLETAPQKRYTQASIIKELEKRGLGTKATRADIIATLLDRHYIKGQKLEPTELGMKVCQILEKYCEKILDEQLTKHFEDEMEKVREQSKKEDEVLSEARAVVTDILTDFKKKEKDIGEALRETFTNTRDEMNMLGPCPACSGTLMMKRGKYGRFAACSSYPECTITAKLPVNGLLEKTDKICEHCKYPFVKIIRKSKRPQEVCLNRDCTTKGGNVEVSGKCPKCKIGNLVLRKSLYGAFVACDAFPKCRHTAQLP